MVGKSLTVLENDNSTPPIKTSFSNLFPNSFKFVQYLTCQSAKSHNQDFNKMPKFVVRLLK